MNFASDNAGPAAPEVIEAVCRANEGHAASYGAEPLMELVLEEVRRQFEAPEASVHLVATGTAANALSVACLCPPWSTIYCHRHSHIEEDECGAPEFFTGGAKLTLLDGNHAKIKPCALHRKLDGAAPVGVHNVQRGVLSVTNATENGSVYACQEVSELTATARGFGLPCHMDGARFANAVVSTGCTAAEMSWKAGIDILSFGGTKNGLLGVEAVIIFAPEQAWEFELRRKRGGHLFSKHRFLSAQMAAYLRDGLWKTLAARSNRMAAKLAAGLSELDRATIVHPVDANMVFAKLTRSAHRRAFASGAKYYLWPPAQSLEGKESKLLEARFVCNWSTTDDEIAELLECLREKS